MAKITSKVDQNRLAVLLACLAVVSVAAIVMVVRGGGGSGGSSSAAKIDFSPHNLPRLEMELIDRERGGGGPISRDPFSFGAPPTPTPRPVLPTPTRRPRTPRPTPTPRMALGADGQNLPPPPPFDREYLGHFGPVRLQVAAFRRKGPDSDRPEVEVAAVGEILEDLKGREIYIVREIGLESVVIGFVGYDRSEDTRVPMSQR
jgi:hypothetical protein